MFEKRKKTIYYRFVGKNCERSVCENNPCKFGATCVIYPGSGFICLCPLGKHGMYCDHGTYIFLL